jgi:hypothetical protein
VFVFNANLADLNLLHGEISNETVEGVLILIVFLLIVNLLANHFHISNIIIGYVCYNFLEHLANTAEHEALEWKK